jgi:phage tail-like protein
MANPATRKDPLPAFCFKVKVVGGGEAFFRSVSGLRYETEVIPVQAGGTNDTTFQLPGATKWSNLVLKQGFTSSSALISWRTEWINGAMKRVNGTITQLDTALNPKAQWDFVRGWPCKWEISDFDATKSELAIESLELAIEGLKFTAL